MNTIEGRQQFIAFTTRPNQRGEVTTLIDRLGAVFQQFDVLPEIGSCYQCAELLTDDGQPIQVLCAKILRQVSLSEVRSLLKQHPNGRLKLQPGVWCEIHAD